MADAPAAGGGYHVDASGLRAFAQIADSAGQSVDTLAQRIRGAFALGVPGGLDIGRALASAEDAWSTRLAQLAGEAASIGSLLAANAASYAQTESDILESLTRQGAQ